MRPPIWSYFAISLLGFWMLFTTIGFHFQPKDLLFTNLIAAIFLILFPLWIRKTPKNWHHILILFFGIWLELSPLIFWAPSVGIYLNNTLIGCFIIALAVIFFPLPNQLPDDEPSIPPGWSYNPSSWPQRVPILLSAFICWMLSRYLAAYQLGYIDTIWDPFFSPGAKGVLESNVAKLFPVSDAGLGALAYTLEFLASCWGGKSRWRTAPWLVIVFGLLVIPVGLVSVILVILQPLAVGTWCTVCLITASTMLIAVPLALDEVVASFQFLQATKWKTLFSGGQCPKAKKDLVTPEMDASCFTICKAGFWGMDFSWTLFCTIPLGILLMASPSAFSLQGSLHSLDPVLGALLIVFSVIAMAEVAKTKNP